MFAPKKTPVFRRPTAGRASALLLLLALTAALAYVLQSSGSKAAAARGRQENPPAALPPKSSKGLAYVPGEVLVRFRAESKAEDASKTGLALRDIVGSEIPVQFERPEGLEIVRVLRVAHVAGEETLRAVALLQIGRAHV